jgi:hypothetical protein
LTREQEDYFFEHFALSESEMKEAEYHPERWLQDQSVATPIGQVTHSMRTQAFINTVRFAQEQQFDGEDMYGVEVITDLSLLLTFCRWLCI